MSRQPASAHFHKSKTLDNKYMLGDEIGKGAYGRVYKGLDLENGDFVAIKQVSLENIRQEDLNIIMAEFDYYRKLETMDVFPQFGIFNGADVLHISWLICSRQEIDLLKNLNHKNIVKYLGSSKTKTHLHIILEYVENGSLANIIKPNKFGPLSESLVAVYITQVLEGLVYLHEQGVIHRDIKGANILTTKEALVKLADFGVATKLTEADVNTHSVVGTPYWMAPEVIEMSGVCAASDIWSVGCTVIELLTCVPPYYDLQPMPALYRIVQDEHPPIPDSLSPDITDFLCQCFKKDAMQRPDAKTLLLHPWIQNSRRALPSSLRETGGTMRDIQRDVSMASEGLIADDQSSESSSGEKVKRDAPEFEPEASRKEFSDAFDIVISDRDQNANSNPVQTNFAEMDSNNSEDDGLSNQSPTLALHEKSSMRSRHGRLLSTREEIVSTLVGTNESNVVGPSEGMSNGEAASSESREKNIVAGEHEGKGTPVLGFGSRNQERSPQKVSKRNQERSPQKSPKQSVVSGVHELSRFSDPPGDASLEDLFHPLDKIPDDRAAEASTSASSSHMSQGNPVLFDAGKSDLAIKLKARMAQKSLESEAGQRNGGDLLRRLMMDVLSEDVAIDIDGLGFEDKISGESIVTLQAVEFSKLVSSLKPGKSEETVVSACQKLIAFFQERPERKIVFVTQHGFFPLMELLEVPKNRVVASLGIDIFGHCVQVICSVLQLINQLVKDNTDFQENACLIGLIPVVMNFAVPDRPREIRTQAAYFLQQLCQSSSLTLQMFIACHGIPVLVGFLEPDYAKYREMVHLAIDGMWQVFKLQRSTPVNDFCCIAAKNGILIRLVNTLHSLNEATRLATISGGGSVTTDGSAQSGQLDPTKVRLVSSDHPLSGGTLEPPRTSASPRSDVNQPGTRYFLGDMGKSHPTHALSEVMVASKLPEPVVQESLANSTTKELAVVVSKDMERLDLWKPDSSRAEVDQPRQQRATNVANRGSNDKSLKRLELASNGVSESANTVVSQHEQVRPLLSLLEKEPPSRHVSGQLEYVLQLSGLERHESILPLLRASAAGKTNSGLDLLMAEFVEVSRHGKENGNLDTNSRVRNKTPNKKIGALGVGSTTNEGAASTSGVASQTASGVLSGSGILNARPGSTTSSGALSQMVAALNGDVAWEYLEKVADLLLEFARADTTVKSSMCSPSLLSRLFQMFNKIERPILLKILKCINHLSADPNCLENLQRADAIKHLIRNLELREEPLITQIHYEVLHTLFNLCKINKRRQEQAAENGIIPHLMHFIMSDSPLKQYALPLLCDMAHASRNSRERLRVHGGLDVYLSLLDNEMWSATALDSLAICLAHDNDHKKVEQALLKKEAVQKLVNFFKCCPEQYFVHILEAFLKIITKSSRINMTLAINGLTPLLIARLNHQDAIARLILLKLIKAVYEHHPRPKQLIVENDLPQKLRNLIEERRDGQHSGGQVLVKQMATALLKALHINTVL